MIPPLSHAEGPFPYNHRVKVEPCGRSSHQPGVEKTDAERHEHHEGAGKAPKGHTIPMCLVAVDRPPAGTRDFRPAPHVVAPSQLLPPNRVFFCSSAVLADRQDRVFGTHTFRDRGMRWTRHGGRRPHGRECHPELRRSPMSSSETSIRMGSGANLMLWRRFSGRVGR